MAGFPQYKNVTAPDLSNLIALQSQGTRSAFNSLVDIGNTLQGIQQKNIDRDNRNLLAQGMLQGLNNDPNLINTINQAVTNSKIPLNQVESLVKIRDEQIKNQQNIFNQRQEIDLSKKSPTQIVNQDPNSIFYDQNTPASPNLLRKVTDANATVTQGENAIKASTLLSNIASNADPYAQKTEIQNTAPNLLIDANAIPKATNLQEEATNRIKALTEARTTDDIIRGNSFNQDALNPNQFALTKSLEDAQTEYAFDIDLKKKVNPANYFPTQTYINTEGESVDKLNQFTQNISQKEKEIKQLNLPVLTKTKKLAELETYKNTFIKDLAKEQINNGNITSPEEAKKIFPKLSDKEANNYIKDAKANGIIYTTLPKQTPGSYGYNTEVARNDVVNQVNVLKNSNQGLYDYTKFSNTTNDIKKVGKTEIKQKLLKDFKEKSGITDTGIEESLSDVRDAYKTKQLEDKTLPSVTDEEILAVIDITSSYDGYIWDKFDGQDYNDQQTSLLNKLVALKRPENELLYKNIQSQSTLLDNNIKSLQKDIDSLLIKLDNAKTEPLKKNVESSLKDKVTELEGLQTEYEKLYTRGN